jgi:hypothetical protein
MTYSTDSDVMRKIAHVALASGLLPKEFRDEAYTDINIELRKLYAVPISSSDDSDLQFLKTIESNMAAGLLILDISATSENESELDAYGEYLIDKGEERLQKLVNRTVVLIGAEDQTDDSSYSEEASFVNLQSPDDYSTFSRPMSEVDQAAADGLVDATENE